MPLVDTSHPFFRPAWRRYGLVIFCACWTGFEVWLGNTFWVGLFAAITGYLAWILILYWQEPEGE